MARRRVARTLIFSLLISLAAGSASACPNCKDSIPDNDAEQPTAVPGGFNTSIYVMLAGVGLVGGLVIRMIVKETRS